MNAIAPVFGCAAGGISCDAALGRVLSLVTEILGEEEVTLMDCTERVIASPFTARSDLPRFDQAAMDGYAVRCNDLTPGTWLPVTGRAVAGDAPSRPAVRAVALNTLINKTAEWPRGYDWQWIDKSMGLRRRGTVFGHRELDVALPRSALIAIGIHDRSAAVRRIALDGVFRHLLPAQEGRDYAALLAADRSPSVRARAEFVLCPR